MVSLIFQSKYSDAQEILYLLNIVRGRIMGTWASPFLKLVSRAPFPSKIAVIIF